MARKLVWNPADNMWAYDDSEMPVPTTEQIGNTLKLPTTPTPAPTAEEQFSDYSPQYENTIADLNARTNQAEEDFAANTNAWNAGFPTQFADLEQQNQQNLRTLRDQMANQGILRSSNYLQGQGRVGSDYVAARDRLIKSQQQGQKFYSDERLKNLKQIGTEKTAAERNYADFKTTQAKNRAQAQADAEAARKAQEELDRYNWELKQQAGLVLTTPTGQLTSGQQQGPIGIVPPGIQGDFPQNTGMPEWAMAGFPDEASYRNAMGQAQHMDWNVPTRGYQPPTDENAIWTQHGPVDPAGFLANPNLTSQGNVGQSILNGPLGEAIKRRLGL